MLLAVVCGVGLPYKSEVAPHFCLACACVRVRGAACLRPPKLLIRRSAEKEQGRKKPVCGVDNPPLAAGREHSLFFLSLLWPRGSLRTRAPRTSLSLLRLVSGRVEGRRAKAGGEKTLPTYHRTGGGVTSKRFQGAARRRVYSGLNNIASWS